MKPKNMIYFLLIVFTLTSSQFAFAERRERSGGQEGNGGDAIENRNGEVRFLDLVRKIGEIIDLEGLGLIDDLKEVLDRHPGLRTATYYPTTTREKTSLVENKILAALDSLTFYRTEKELPDTYDRGQVILPWKYEGRIIRLGLQDKKNYVVLVNGPVFDRLPREDQLAFLLHEALIRVYFDDFHNDYLMTTEKIAIVVKAIFKKETKLGARIAARYFCDASIMVNEKRHPGLSYVPGILSLETIYPKHVVAFAYINESCRALELTRKGEGLGEHTRERDSYGYLREMVFTQFEGIDNLGNSYPAELMVTGSDDPERSPTIMFSAELPSPQGIHIWDNGYVAIKKQRFGFWTSDEIK